MVARMILDPLHAGLRKAIQALLTAAHEEIALGQKVAHVRRLWLAHVREPVRDLIRFPFPGNRVGVIFEAVCDRRSDFVLLVRIDLPDKLADRYGATRPPPRRAVRAVASHGGGLRRRTRVQILVQLGIYVVAIRALDLDLQVGALYANP